MIKQIVKIGKLYYLRKLTIAGWKFYNHKSGVWFYDYSWFPGVESEEEIRNAYSNSKSTLKHVAWM